MKRLPEIDAARGFTVLIMPAVHTVMLYGKPSVHSSWLGYILAFLAEGPGAQLFMLLMGFSMMLSTKKTVLQDFKRATSLFLMGYMLNWLRLVLPYQAGILPGRLLMDYGIDPNLSTNIPLKLLAIGDILQFAGIAYLTISFVKKSRHAVWLAGILAIATIFVSPFLWGMRWGNPVVDQLLILLADNGEHAFFPLFPWLCYPLAGMVIGHLYRQVTVTSFYRHMFWFGCSILIVGIVVSKVSPISWEGDFYRSGPGRSIYQIGFVMLWLCVMRFSVKRFPNSFFNRLLAYCSRHITEIYIIQWVIIGWGIGSAGYHDLGLTASILALATTTLLSFGITLLIGFRKNRRPSLADPNIL